MKILLTSHYVLPHLGGVEVVVDKLASEYVRRGCSVTVLSSGCLRPGESMLRHAEEPYKVIRLPALNLTERKFSIPYPIFEPFGLMSEIRRQCADADVVHAHGMLYQNSLLALRTARGVGQSIRVLTEHAGTVHYESATVRAIESIAVNTIGRMTAAASDAIVVVGKRVEREMSQRFPTKRVIQIVNGVDHEVFHPASPEERQQWRQDLGWDDAPRILFVGRVVERKGAPLAIEMARRNTDLRLIIVGPSDQTNIAGVSHHYGPVDTSLLAKIYQAADVFLLPSHGEGGFPLTAREAMACGLPCVLREDVSYAGAVDGLDAGVVFTSPDPDTLATAVRALLADGTRARDVVAAFARENFQWSTTAEKHLDLYRQLMADRSTTA